MTGLFRTGFAALMLLALVLPCQAEKRIALVIGNSGYQNATRLPNPVNDAASIADLFKKAGFDVVSSRKDLGNLEFKRALREFTVQAATADIAVVYYAGHGIEAKGANYLLPVDVKLANEYDAEDEAIPLSRVIETIEPAKRLRLIILDACRDNPFNRTMQRSVASRSMSTGLAAISEPSTDTLIAYAAKAGSTAADGDTQHSPFTTALLNNLTTPGLDLRLAFGRVRDDVMKATRRTQEPFVYGSLGGATVALVPAPDQPVAAPSVATDPGAAMHRDYEAAREVGTREAWDSFLSVYKTGLYADLARAQRQKLADRTAPPTADKPPASSKPAVAEKAATPDKMASATPGNTTAERSNSASSPPARPSCGPTVAQNTSRLPAASLRVNLAGAKEVRAVAMSPDGSEIATAGDDGYIHVWDAASFRMMRTQSGHQGPVYSIDYWMDGSLMASGGWDGTVKVWSVPDGRLLHSFEAMPAPGEPQTGRLKQYAVAFYPKAPVQFLASAGEDGYVRIWDWQRKTLVRAQADHKGRNADEAPVRSLSYAPGGSGEFATAGFDGRLRFYRTERGRVDTRDAYSRKAIRVVYAPDSARLVSAGSSAGKADAESNLKLWNAKGDFIRSLVGHGDYVVSASWSADGSYIVSGGGGLDRTVRLWDSNSGRELAAFAGHTGDIEAVVFDSRRSRLISVSEDKTMKVWSVADRKELLTLVGFGERDYVAYTPIGCYTGSRGVETRLSLLDGATGKPLTDDAKAALFAPDGFAVRP